MFETFSGTISTAYLELLWPVFSLIWTEYGDTRSTSPYSFLIRENTDQNNFEYGRLSHSVHPTKIAVFIQIGE